MSRRTKLALVAILSLGLLLAWMLWPRTWEPRYAAPVASAQQVPNVADGAGAASQPESAAPAVAPVASRSRSLASAQLARLHQLDQAHCSRFARPWDAILALVTAPQPPDSAASLPEPLRKQAEGLESLMTEAQERSLALRLVQLDERTDDFSRGVALHLRELDGQLPALAQRSPDARLVRLALYRGCKRDDEACRAPLRERWLRLEPQNAAAWMAQWEALRRPDPKVSAADAERQKEALLAGMAQAHVFDAGVYDVARVALSGPGPATNGLHATAEAVEWIGRVAAQPIPGFSTWLQHCRPPQTPLGSARARACLASAEVFWRPAPSTFVDAMVSVAVAERLGAMGEEPWKSRKQQIEALKALSGRIGERSPWQLLSELACRPDPAMQGYFRQWLQDDELAAMRSHMKQLGLDEARLAAEFSAKQRQAASAPP